MKALTDRTLVFAEIKNPEELSSAEERGADGVILTVGAKDAENVIPTVLFGAGETMELDDAYKILKKTGLAVQLFLTERENDGFIRELDYCAQRREMAGRIVYSSAWHKDLVAVSARMPDAFIAPVYRENLVKPWAYAAYMGGRAVVAPAAEVLADPDYADRAHNMNIRVHVYEIPDTDAVKTLVGRGCDVLMTERIEEARALVW